uniref:ENT domain-containing protein n=2 Tax=Kalanchoe fedtschenkoi TaxID=63787 RepID=A0A7N0T7S3_KALFE
MSCSFFWFRWIIAIMKFTKGCKIEVFSKRDVSLGSWRPAEIISGNGHNYTVKYDRFLADEPVIGWVSQKAIRPRPPVKTSDWLCGDIVEVFNNFSWKLATILKGLGKKQVLVKLHGSSEDLMVSMDYIRVRQSWEDDKWIVTGKRSLNCEDGKEYEMQTDSKHRLKISSLYWPTEYESYERAAKRYRHAENEGQTYRVTEDLIPSSDHAYSMPSLCKMEGKKHGRTSLIIRFPVIAQRNESNHSVDSLSSVSSDSNDEDSDWCSVGSCSTTDSWRQFMNYGLADDSNGDLSDAESSCVSSRDEHHLILESVKEAAAGRIHQLELHGYRCTLQALHASGPLSWEQQSLISNLRLSLNISNDEHLMELKSLLSSDHES